MTTPTPREAADRIAEDLTVTSPKPELDADGNHIGPYTPAEWDGMDDDPQTVPVDLEAAHVLVDHVRAQDPAAGGDNLAALREWLDERIAKCEHVLSLVWEEDDPRAGIADRLGVLRDVRDRLPADAATEGGESWTPRNDVHDRDHYRWREIAPDRWREAHAVDGAATYAELVEHRGPLTDAPPAATPGVQGTAEAATEGDERWEVAWVKPGTREPENGEPVAPGWWVIGWSEPRGDYPFSTIYVEFSYDDNGDDMTERVARRVAAGLAVTHREQGTAETGRSKR